MNVDTGLGWAVSQIVSTSRLAILIFVLVFALIIRILYYIYLHPLSSFKGPKYLAASDIPLAFFQLRGTSHHVLAKAHQDYGSVVRIGPNTLSFIEPSAWNEIYGSRKGRTVLPKDPQFYNEMLLDKKTLTMASHEDAVSIRRAMLPAFSPKALLELEPTFQGHINHLMTQLANTSLEKGSVDLRMWFTSSMFDISSDFAFGEDLGCVRNGKFHEWVQNVVSFFYIATLLYQCHKFWPLNRILAALIPPSVKAMKENHEQAALQRVRRRINNPTDRHDFVSHFLQSAQKENLSMPVIEAQSTIVILAGSQTTATALNAAVYYILSNNDVYKKLCTEIRSAFAHSAEISLQNIASKLPYLGAVVKEALRIHTPVANGLPRLIPDGGAVISGRWVPPNTVVTINPYAANRSAENFRDPHSFVPERWLNDPAYDSDKRDVVQAFSFGPRDCIGKRFALNNINLTLTHLFWKFDAKLDDGARDWAVDQRIYSDWQLPELPVVLTKRSQAS